MQTLTALIAILWSGLFTLIIGLAIKATIGWRINEEDEVEGIDFTEHGESAYDLFGPRRRPPLVGAADRLGGGHSGGGRH